MRVLWVCNIMLPDIAKALGEEYSVREGWLSGILNRILQEEDDSLMLGISFPARSELADFGQRLVLGEQKKEIACYGFGEDLEHPETYDSSMELRFAQILSDFRPDLVHIFGTEFPHAYACAKVWKQPNKTLVGIQGVCASIADAYMADLPAGVQKGRTLRDILRKDSLRQQQEKFQLRGEREKNLLQLCNHVAGRTLFDKAAAAAANPAASYHFMNETMRSGFYEGSWSLEKCSRGEIFISQADYPLKGFHYLLQAMKEILQEVPEAHITLAGNSVLGNGGVKSRLKLPAYGKYLRSLIRQNRLEGKIRVLGRLSEEEMKQAYLNCHVFVCPSVLENSPNSVAEAQLLGVPVVASNAGGISSVVEDNVSGLLFEKGNIHGLAQAVLSVLQSDEGAERLSAQEREAAAHQYDGERNYHTLMSIYGEIYSGMSQQAAGDSSVAKNGTKVVFLSNYINHHQIPFSNALYAKLGADYTFIQTEAMEEERVKMGWALDAARIPYVVFSYEEEERCKKLLEDADIVLAGWTQRTDLILPRLASGKLTFRISERIYREGQFKALSPRGLVAKYKEHIRFRKQPVYLLCAGAYVASDFSLIHAYPGKKYRFGYFPETRLYEGSSLFEKKGNPKDCLQLVWAGRMISLKHPEYVVRLVKELHAEGRSFHLHLIGSGPMEMEIRQELEQAGLAGCVTFYGFLPAERVREVMERCHVHLFTSNYLEGWGVVLNEAMNSGCCVVANAQVGAVPYLLSDGVNGLVYENGSYENFALKVRQLFENPSSVTRLGRAAYRTITEEWNAEHAAEAVLHFYESWKAGNPEIPESGPLSVAPVMSAHWKYNEGKLE